MRYSSSDLPVGCLVLPDLNFYYLYSACRLNTGFLKPLFFTRKILF
jgi:hypothetical protein